MAEIIRSTSEPMIGQMRLTWWHEALTKDPKAGGSGEPLMAALRRQVLPLSGGESLLSIIDGWEVLLQPLPLSDRSEEHTSELQSLMRISYAVFCLKKKNTPP